MKLKVKGKLMKTAIEDEVKKTSKKGGAVTEDKKKSRKKSTLPSDTYEPLFPPTRVVTKKTTSKEGLPVIYGLEFKALREPDMGIPCIFISKWIESPSYTGFMKGGSFQFPVSQGADIVKHIQNLALKCEKAKIIE